MRFNCDLGEGFGQWSLGRDGELMPHIDQANIACGFHAGDPLTIERTLRLAAKHGVSVGAHPAYPDLVGFGRRSMMLSDQELRATLHYQIAALDGMAAIAGTQLDYVKPHGALYNDMMRSEAILYTLMDAVAEYRKPLKFMVQAGPQSDRHREIAKAKGLTLYFEAFADRCYDDSGLLVPRREAGAVKDLAGMLDQARQLIEDASVTSRSGSRLPVSADTLCIHGDSPDAVEAVIALRAAHPRARP